MLLNNVFIIFKGCCSSVVCPQDVDEVRIVAFGTILSQLGQMKTSLLVLLLASPQISRVVDRLNTFDEFGLPTVFAGAEANKPRRLMVINYALINLETLCNGNARGYKLFFDITDSLESYSYKISLSIEVVLGNGFHVKIGSSVQIIHISKVMSVNLWLVRNKLLIVNIWIKNGAVLDFTFGNQVEEIITVV